MMCSVTSRPRCGSPFRFTTRIESRRFPSEYPFPADEYTRMKYAAERTMNETSGTCTCPPLTRCTSAASSASRATSITPATDRAVSDANTPGEMLARSISTAEPRSDSSLFVLCGKVFGAHHGAHALSTVASWSRKTGLACTAATRNDPGTSGTRAPLGNVVRANLILHDEHRHVAVAQPLAEGRQVVVRPLVQGGA